MDGAERQLLEEIQRTADRTEEAVQKMRYILLGNGEPGVVGDVWSLKTWRKSVEATGNRSGLWWRDLGRSLLVALFAAVLTLAGTLLV